MLSLLTGRSRLILAAGIKVSSRYPVANSLSGAVGTIASAPCMSSSSNNNNNGSVRLLSSGGKHDKFSPRRRPGANYRPVRPRGNKLKMMKGNKGFPYGNEKIHKSEDQIIELGDGEKPATGAETYPYDEDGLTAQFGVDIANAIRYKQREQNVYKGRRQTVDDMLRDMDYLTAAPGSTEDLVGERRALSFETQSEEEKELFLKNLDNIIEQQRVKDLELEPWEDPFEDDGKPGPINMDMNDPLTSINPNQLAHGEWGELVIRVDRNIKLWRGGRIQSYRALVIGGNLNGCAGFGTGKAPEAREAVLAASRKCKRNIFFVDRYQGNSLTRDLVGKSNSCRVVLRATNRGLRGNPLCIEILKYFGITNCTAKSVHGNRSQFNVVRATFKALMTHESMEEIALKRGRRIISVDRGRRLQL